ncbi:hypothetical protein CCACVL1_20320 [Corchorus capsularis]|uniref:XS domain-containing protein n=1 Tax=Corchorus capsularis TaxID=210143 RepID=A0A1R3HBR6_COCAP|nr:hypothetical protein CCACVL1_20320 [Corchorus capsularis]
MYVYPWMGIIANIPTKQQGGKRVGESGRRMREELTAKGFNPMRVHPLWNRFGHSGYAIVEFNKEWDGFSNAIQFEKSFEGKGCGKKDFYASRKREDKLYGWVAREDDYRARGLISDYLHKHGDLKTISGKEAEDIRKDTKLVITLNNTLETKFQHLKEMENKCLEANISYNTLMMQKDEMTKAYNAETRKMQQDAHDHFKAISVEHEKVTQNLVDQKRQLDLREKELLQREAQNEAEARKLKQEKEIVCKVLSSLLYIAVSQNKANESMLKLAEEQKKEKERLHSEILKLEKQLDTKQALELEIQRMKGALQVMQHMEGDGESDVKTKMKDIEEQLKEKEEEYDDLEQLNQTLIIKERKSNEELQEAKKELIKSLSGNTRAHIGVKRMGDLDAKPFVTAARSKFSGKEAGEKAMELCSEWEDYLRDPSWHPFKILTDEEGKAKEIINETDEKLTALKTEYGDEAYKAVVTALSEMNEYNPSGRYIVPELWNFQEKRKASMQEGVEYLLKQWKLNRRKK